MGWTENVYKDKGTILIYLPCFEWNTDAFYQNAQIPTTIMAVVSRFSSKIVKMLISEE